MNPVARLSLVDRADAESVDRGAVPPAEGGSIVAVLAPGGGERG